MNIQDFAHIIPAGPRLSSCEDGDGRQGLLYASYDGRVHAFWLDRTEHGNRPYAAYSGGPYRFASEPVVADLDADGLAEVILGRGCNRAQT